MLQEILGGLTIDHLVLNSQQFMSAKSYDNWLTVDQCYCNDKRMKFFATTVYRVWLKMFKRLKCDYAVIHESLMTMDNDDLMIIVLNSC